MRLELGVCPREGLLDGFVELGAHPLHRCALLLALSREAIGIRGEANLDLQEQLLLTLGELADACLRHVRRAIEILRPPGEPLLDLALGYGERLGHRCREVALALRELAPMVVCDLSLLFH